MDSFELNKIIGAILGTLLFIMGVGFLAEAIYEPIKDVGAGYELPEAADDGGEGDTPEAPAAVDIGTLLAAANVGDGQASAKKCQSCHDFTSGGPNKTGPNLYDVVERVVGSHPGFAYSAGMLEHQAKGDTWTYQNLDHFLLSPKTFTPGTKMTFAGIKDDTERANVIAYLSTLSASPKPFPAPANPEGAAPAEQTTEGAAPVEAAPVESPTPIEASSSEAMAAEPSSVEAPAASSSEAPMAPAVSSEAPMAPEASSSEAPMAMEASSSSAP